MYYIATTPSEIVLKGLLHAQVFLLHMSELAQGFSILSEIFALATLQVSLHCLRSTMSNSIKAVPC